MEKIAEDGSGVPLRLSETEFVTARQSLNEVTNGIRIPDFEFATRLGGSRAETRHLGHTFRDAVDTSGFSPGTRRDQAIGPEGMTIRLSQADLILLRNSMIEITKGVEIEEWEYPIRVGVPLAEGKKLLGEIEDLIGSATT